MGPNTNPLYHQISVIDECILIDNRLAIPGQLRQAIVRRIHRGHSGKEDMLTVSNFL